MGLKDGSHTIMISVTIHCPEKEIQIPACEILQAGVSIEPLIKSTLEISVLILYDFHGVDFGVKAI